MRKSPALPAAVGHVIGYARVSTADQDAELQRDALQKVGAVRVFEDVASGAKADRPGLAEALAYLREGDTLAVWKLDRLGRSLPHLVQTVAELAQRGVGFRSLTETIDTGTPNGRLVFHLFAALADFERDLIRERTRAGLAVAKARGRNGGRRPVITPEKLARARELIEVKGLTVREAAARVKVGKTALYAALSSEGPAAHEATVERWLREEVAPAYDEMKADPSQALTVDQVRHSLAESRRRRKSKIAR